MKGREYVFTSITNDECYDCTNESKAANNKSKRLDHTLLILFPVKQAVISSIVYQKNTISCYKEITLYVS